MFNPDPKGKPKEKKPKKGIKTDPYKLVKRTCHVCKKSYKNVFKDKVTKWCSQECREKYVIEFYRKKREKDIKAAKKAERAAWKKRKEKMKEEIGYKPKIQASDKLQTEINQIARIIDKNRPCFVKDTFKTSRWDAGHIYGVGNNNTLRYLLLNIHKESVESNTNQNRGTKQRLDALERVYGIEVKECLEWCARENKLIQLRGAIKEEKIKIARRIKKELKAGANYSRREIDEELGIYKLPENYNI